MDMIKIGRFLATLRNEKSMTQEQLGERLGVTNKTVSRWETGVYLPPVEILQMLSGLYGITINEILCGERLEEAQYKESAEKNLAQTLKRSVFTLNDEKEYFKKKWKKDHLFEIVLTFLLILVSVVLSALFYRELLLPIVILGDIWAITLRNRMAAYLERHIYDSRSPDEKEDR